MPGKNANLETSHQAAVPSASQPALKSALADIIAAHRHREGPVLPILHDVQAAYGCIAPEAQSVIAEALNLSRADVYGVVSFYHDFTQTYDPRPRLQLCHAEACIARGAEALLSVAKNACADRVALSHVACLGLCAAGPAARVGDRLYARLDTDGLERLIENIECA